MPKKARYIKCKYCGSTFRQLGDKYVLKTWHKVAPMPDKHGNITISIMAVWVCPNCGKKNMGKLTSIKSGSDIRGRNYTQRLIDIITSHQEISISEIAQKLGMEEKTVEKAVDYLIRKNILKAKKEDNIVKLC